MKSLFIVFDGMDGAGKGEMITRLEAYLKVKYSVLVTREPTEHEHGRKVRMLLQQDNDPLEHAELCLDLFVKDREQHLQQDVLPFLQQPSAIVLCDRYYYSTIAFQHTQGLDLTLLVDRNRHFLKPDIAFILDVDPDIALKRIAERGKGTEKFENRKFMQKLRENFLMLENIMDDRIIVLDAGKTKEEVFAAIKHEVDTLLC